MHSVHKSGFVVLQVAQEELQHYIISKDKKYPALLIIFLFIILDFYLKFLLFLINFSIIIKITRLSSQQNLVQYNIYFLFQNFNNDANNI